MKAPVFQMMAGRMRTVPKPVDGFAMPSTITEPLPKMRGSAACGTCAALLRLNAARLHGVLSC